MVVMITGNHYDFVKQISLDNGLDKLLESHERLAHRAQRNSTGLSRFIVGLWCPVPLSCRNGPACLNDKLQAVDEFFQDPRPVREAGFGRSGHQVGEQAFLLAEMEIRETHILKTWRLSLRGGETSVRTDFQRGLRRLCTLLT